MDKHELLKEYNHMLDEIEFMARQESEEIFEFTRTVYDMLTNFRAKIEKLQ